MERELPVTYRPPTPLLDVPAAADEEDDDKPLVLGAVVVAGSIALPLKTFEWAGLIGWSDPLITLIRGLDAMDPVTPAPPVETVLSTAVLPLPPPLPACCCCCWVLNFMSVSKRVGAGGATAAGGGAAAGTGTGFGFVCGCGTAGGCGGGGRNAVLVACPAAVAGAFAIAGGFGGATNGAWPVVAMVLPEMPPSEAARLILGGDPGSTVFADKAVTLTDALRPYAGGTGGGGGGGGAALTTTGLLLLLVTTTIGTGAASTNFFAGAEPSDVRLPLLP